MNHPHTLAAVLLGGYERKGKSGDFEVFKGLRRHALRCGLYANDRYCKEYLLQIHGSAQKWGLKPHF